MPHRGGWRRAREFTVIDSERAIGLAAFHAVIEPHRESRLSARIMETEKRINQTRARGQETVRRRPKKVGKKLKWNEPHYVCTISSRERRICNKTILFCHGGGDGGDKHGCDAYDDAMSGSGTEFPIFGAVPRGDIICPVIYRIQSSYVRYWFANTFDLLFSRWAVL